MCLGPTLEPQVPAVGLGREVLSTYLYIILPVLSEGRTYMYTCVDSVGWCSPPVTGSGSIHAQYVIPGCPQGSNNPHCQHGGNSPGQAG